MRSYPIDSDRLNLMSTGTVTPVPLWVELSDGSRRIDPNGRQAVNGHGETLWTVEAVAPASGDDARDKTEVLSIEIASNERPESGPFGTPLRFDGLTVSAPYVKRGTSQLTPGRWSASGIRRAVRQAA